MDSENSENSSETSDRIDDSHGFYDDDDDESIIENPSRKRKRKGESPKKCRKAIPIEQLITEKQWDDVRKRLQRTSSPKRIGELLYHSADDPNVPDDIFEILLSKLEGKRKNTEASNGWIVKFDFWSIVCNYQRERGYQKEFKDVCQNRSVSSLTLFMKTCLKTAGPLSIIEARTTICSLWNQYLRSKDSTANRYYSYSRNLCKNEIESTLINIKSMNDLLNQEELHSLWQKTEILIKSTQKNIIQKSADKLLFVHLVIKTRLPRIILLLALHLYPKHVSRKDKFGKFPLHIAASMNNEDSEEGFHFTFNLKLLKRRYVDIILWRCPKVATKFDKDGSFPLHVLLDDEYRSWTMNDWMKRCMLSLVKYAPEALTRRSKLNYMMPFMTAACIYDMNTVKASTKCEEQNMLLRKLDLTYCLLRADPSVLASFRVETAHEKFFRSQVGGLQSQVKDLQSQVKDLQNQVKELKSITHNQKEEIA